MNRAFSGAALLFVALSIVFALAGHRLTAVEFLGLAAALLLFGAGRAHPEGRSRATVWGYIVVAGVLIIAIAPHLR